MSTSVLAIDVQSAEFEQFLQEFNKYQQALGAMPEQYRSLAKKMGDVFTAGTKGIKNMGNEAKKQTKSVSLFDRAWKGVGKTLKTVEKTVKGIGKAIDSLIPGLGTASIVAGGLIGIPAAFAAAFIGSQGWASNGRTQNMATGTSQGSRVAFNNQFSTYGLSESNLAGMESEKADYAQAGKLMLATGVNHDQAQHMDTAELVLKSMERIKDAQEHGNMATARAISSAAGFNEGQLQNILQHSRQEMESDMSKYRQQRSQDQLSDSDQKNAQDFMRQLGDLGNWFKTWFFNLTAKLEGPISTLVASFKKFMQAFAKSGILDKVIAKLGTGLQQLGDYINKPEFIADMKSLIKNIGEFAKAVWDAIKFVNHILHPFSSDDDDKRTDADKKAKQDAAKAGGKSGAVQGAISGAVAGAALGSVIPLVGTVAGGAVGAAVGGIAGLYEGSGRAKDAYNSAHPLPANVAAATGPYPTAAAPVAAGAAQGSYRYATLAGASESAADSTTGVSGILARSIMQESHGNPLAKSGAGAQGYLQWMPATAKQYGVKVGDLESEKAGWLKYYGRLMNKFHDARAAAASYNWGEGNVQNAMKQYGSDWLSHAPKETQHYVNVVVDNRSGSDVSTGLAGSSYMPQF